MASSLSEVLSAGVSAVEAINAIYNPNSNQERKMTDLKDAFAQLSQDCATRQKDVESKKKSMQESKYKYENLSDLADSLAQLRDTLDENRRQVRQTESSIGSTGNVLEFDAAKTRSHKLIQIISAKVQYERAREALKDAEGDEPNRRLACIADLQTAHETLQKHLPNPGVNKELEELKDGFLAWQSAALAIAIQQADYNKLLEIQKIYDSLARNDEFVKIFRRVCSSRLKDLDLSSVDSIQTLFSTLYREIEYILKHYLAVIRRFHDEETASTLIKQAVEEGLENLNLSTPLSSLIGQAEDPLALTSSIRKTFADFKDKLSKDPAYVKFTDIINVLKTRSVDIMVDPFKSSFTNSILAKINSLELKGASHRQHIENLNTSIAETMQLLQDIVTHSIQLFGQEIAPSVYRQSLERCIDNLGTKLKMWEYWKSSSGQPRSVEDLFLVCSSSGHLIRSLIEFNSMIESDSWKLNTKPISRFNTSCCDRVMKRAAESVIGKMRTAIQEIKSAEDVDDTHTRSLPLFSISPHEYITNSGQDLLHLFHRFEQFFLDDNVLNAFHVAMKKKIEGDEILKCVVADISEKVVSEFVSSIGDLLALKHAHAKQFLVDTTFLKDALFDLRYEELEQLQQLETSLKEIVEEKK